MTDQNYQICSNCIMDKSDKTLLFDERGWCEYCQNFETNIAPTWQPGDVSVEAISPYIEQIKKDGVGKEYDCLIGLSGGLDSSYVAYVAKEKFGLRPLLFHCDAGWNSDLGVSNIQKMVDGLGLDLFTEVINWDEMKDLQRAFFKSQVPFVDQPQDLALFSAIYKFAAKNNFKYIITGGNNSTECIRESIDWTYFSTDVRHVLDIHKKFGESKLTTFPMCDLFTYKLKYRLLKGIRVIKLLDYVKFTKKEAIKELQEKFRWQPYQMKHYESRFTRFFESYWTPKKHGYDKRRAYFSSEILTGQMTRDEALDRISRSELDELTMEKEFEYVASKLDWSVEEFKEIFNGENKSFKDYKNSFWLIRLGAKLAHILHIDRRLFR